MELALTGIGIVLCAITWRGMWKPSTLDTARDRLFDLRDRQVRGWFLEHGIPLDHPIYVALRDLLNGMLKNTDTLTFSHVVWLLAWAEEHPDIEARRRKILEARFATDDPRLKQLVREVRENASGVMFAYVIESSPAALFFALMGAIAVFVARACRWVITVFRNGGGMVRAPLRTHLAAALLTCATLMGLTSRATAQATMEEKAFSVQYPA